MPARAGSQGAVASAPPRPGLGPGAARPRERIECWITKPTPGATLAEGPQGCHLTLECTGISSTPGDTLPGGEIAEAPGELENWMGPALVWVRAVLRRKERGPGLGEGVEPGRGALGDSKGIHKVLISRWCVDAGKDRARLNRV